MSGPLDFGLYGLSDRTIMLEDHFKAIIVMIDGQRYDDARSALVQLNNGIDMLCHQEADDCAPCLDMMFDDCDVCDYHDYEL